MAAWRGTSLDTLKDSTSTIFRSSTRPITSIIPQNQLSRGNGKFHIGRHGQAPSKPLPPPAKLNAIMAFFHSSCTAHPFKDLEKSLPAASGVSGMQVKDILQSLVDESLIRVEKIGSGNWYWSFVGDERKRRVGLMKSLKEEKGGLEKQIDAIKEIAMQERERMQEEGGQEQEREAMIHEMVVLRKKKAELESEIASWKDNDPVELERRKAIIGQTKTAINMWTDNIYTLLSFVRTMTDGDKESIGAIWNEFLGGCGEGGGEGELEYAE
ncbi:Mnd1 family-domain-containing protein [Peziza echinospora]|nr:Mnd1 family-domain-containing protein [Peziza echinospora]